MFGKYFDFCRGTFLVVHCWVLNSLLKYKYPELFSNRLFEKDKEELYVRCKKTYEENGSFLNGTLQSFVEKNCLNHSDLWDEEGSCFLWNAKLYPVCTSWKLSEKRVSAG